MTVSRASRARAPPTCLPPALTPRGAAPRSLFTQIVDLRWRGNDLVATAQVLRTPGGKVLERLVCAGERCVAPHASCAAVRVRSGTPWWSVWALICLCRLTPLVPPPRLRHVSVGIASRGWATLHPDPETDVVYVGDDYELVRARGRLWRSGARSQRLGV